MVKEASIREQAKVDNVTHMATGIAVFQNDKLLVVKRVTEDDFLGGEWELPGGGVDPEEKVVQGALRELFEETGLTVEKVLGTFEGFDYTTPSKPKVRQINFKVTVKPGDIRLEPTEHDDYLWITKDGISALQTNEVMQECLRNAFKDAGYGLA